MAPEEDDPVIASYDVYISNPPTTTSSKPPRVFVLQYQSHRPSTKPYDSAHSQRPTSLRIKPETGIFELDIPIPTSNNYNQPLGTQLGRTVREAKLAHPNSTHGLGGGFAQNLQQQTSTTPNNLTSAPDYNPIPNTSSDLSLRTQTLGGKLSVSTDKDPVYMLATIAPRSQSLHLCHVDAVVQMRPQLHHIDAADDLKRRAESAAAAMGTTGKLKTEVLGPDGKIKLETKAIEMKLKDSSKEDPKDRNLNKNAKLLRAIQNETWNRYEWVEKQGSTPALTSAIPATSSSSADTDTVAAPPQQLKSALDNDEWLNRMSSPGIELRTRLKGRDRERARRKRQERLRAAKTEVGASSAGITTGGETAGSESSGGSDEDDHHDAGLGTRANVQEVEDGDTEMTVSPDVQIKQEGGASGTVGVSGVVSTAAPSTGASTTPRRRGRPPKNRKGEIVSLD